MNEYGRESMPFLFAIDYSARQPLLIPLSEVNSQHVLYEIPGRTNVSQSTSESGDLSFSKLPEPFSAYEQKFSRVMAHIRRGDSYLLNLTCRTPVEFNTDLRSLFFRARATYKLLLAEQVLVFSPECFVKIEGGHIYSYPMKGTIDAAIADAESHILKDPKETAEQHTIVDLIRNDLSQVASGVRVETFRDVSRLHTNQKDLLQVSSTISGTLANDWSAHIGDLFRALLPAGSVTGAPKQKTCEIIEEVEGYERGYYTGVFGVFDGTSLDSAVMIRYIERDKDGYVFKSGGGITINSDAKAEYQEMIDKVYVPLI